MKRIRNISLIVLLFVFITLFSFSIKSKASNSVYRNYLNSKSLNSGLVYEPTLILDLKDLSDLDGDTVNYVTSVILNIDASINVCIGNEKYEFEDLKKM